MLDDMPRLPQALDDETGDVPIILHQQDPHLGLSSPSVVLLSLSHGP
jgi:hypothetical protein